MFRPASVALCVLLLSAAASAQTPEKSSARDLFFSGLEEYKSGKTGRIKTELSTPTPSKAEPRVSKPPTSGTTARKSTTQRHSGTYTPAANRPGKPLGVRYSLLKLQGVSSVEVPPNAVFRSGERIQLKIDVNDEGYLYLVSRGTSGKWNVLFPSDKVAGGSNHVTPGQSYVVPQDSAFIFRGNPGSEKLFLVLSRQPEPELHQLIYDLRERNGETDRKQPLPSAPPPLMARNQVSDPLIDRLRATSRDLVLESTEDESHAATREQAVYVVNTTGAADARVVVDITLVHR